MILLLTCDVSSLRAGDVVHVSLSQLSVVRVPDAAPLLSHICPVVSMAASVYTPLLASGDASGRVIVWNTDLGSCPYRIQS